MEDLEIYTPASGIASSRTAASMETFLLKAVEGFSVELLEFT